MTIRQIADDIAQVWGFPDFSAVPDFGKDRIRTEINSAIQQMQDAGEDFYGREDLTITLMAGTSEYELPISVQSVLEPVTLEDNTMLRKLTSFGQFLQYGSFFRESLSSSVDDGKPEAYFVDAVKSSDANDSVKTILHLLPAPSPANASNSAIVAVIKEAGLFTTAQLTAGTSSLPIPHKYVESIFLPLARYNATTCFLFYKKDSEGKYLADYERALKLLGRADPRQYPKPPDSNRQALEVQPPQQGGPQ